jgi:transposase
LSQGRKEKLEPALFVVAGEVYAHIPRRHFYEELDRVMELSFVHELTRPLYAERMGRPSLDPVVFFKCMLIGFFENIVYDTELEFRIADSLLLRKFLGYSLEERTPDESTLRKTRQRMPEEAFHIVFGYVEKVCQEHGLLRGRALGTDSALVDANASMDSLMHKELGCSYEEYVLALRRQDKPEASLEEAAQADKKREGKASNGDWVSGTDPESRVMQHADGHTHLSYRVDTTVDLETGVIVSAGAQYGNMSDQADCLERIDEATAALEDVGLKAEVVVADKGHHSGENLVGIEERGLVPLVSSPNRKRGEEGFRREDFVREVLTDTLICPAGQVLNRQSNRDDGARHYKAKGSICRACPNFGVCTTSMSGRAVAISVYEEQVLANRERVHSEEFRPLMQIRRQRGEAPFGYFKMFGGLRRFAGRGLAYATKKTLVAAIGWNLLLLVKAVMRSRGLDSPVSLLIRLLFAVWTLIRRVLERTWTQGRTTPQSRVQFLQPPPGVALSGGC